MISQKQLWRRLLDFVLATNPCTLCSKVSLLAGYSGSNSELFITKNVYTWCLFEGGVCNFNCICFTVK